jgi:hypothetical protein
MHAKTVLCAVAGALALLAVASVPTPAEAHWDGGPPPPPYAWRPTPYRHHWRPEVWQPPPPRYYGPPPGYRYGPPPRPYYGQYGYVR